MYKPDSCGGYMECIFRWWPLSGFYEIDIPLSVCITLINTKQGLFKLCRPAFVPEQSWSKFSSIILHHYISGRTDFPLWNVVFRHQNGFPLRNVEIISSAAIGLSCGTKCPEPLTVTTDSCLYCFTKPATWRELGVSLKYHCLRGYVTGKSRPSTNHSSPRKLQAISTSPLYTITRFPWARTFLYCCFISW